MAEARGLQNVLKLQQAEERERAVRALLMQPLLSAGNPELASVQRHAEYLREWFGRETGWHLQVERQCARLYKRPATLDDTTRGLPEFDRDRYVLFCLACSVFEQAESQITLRSLGDRLLEVAADSELRECGFTFTLESLRERRALVSVCRLLLQLGVLGRVAGDEETYVNQSGDVLYDVHRRVLARLPAGTQGASLIAATQPNLNFEARLNMLVADYVPDSEEGQRTALRHRLARRLLDDPVLYHDELSVEEREYLASQRGPMANRLAQGAGLKAELRAEGLGLVDEWGELSDERLPAVGTEAHVTLLIAEYLARAARADEASIHSLHELAAFVREAADRYGRYWRKDARVAGAEMDLAQQAVNRLEALRLVRRVDGGVRSRPALHRYHIVETEV